VCRIFVASQAVIIPDSIRMNNSSPQRHNIFSILNESATSADTEPEVESTTLIAEMSQMSISASPSPPTMWTPSRESSPLYDVVSLSDLAVRTRKEYDMLLFHWRYVFGSDWFRSLMISDAEYATKNLNSVIQLSDLFKEHNFYLVKQYNNRLDGISDLHFVFDQVKRHRNSHRFFNFSSFGAEMLWVSYKLDLWPYFNSSPLPRDFQSWRKLVQQKIVHYLRNTLCLDDKQYHAVIQKVIGVKVQMNGFGKKYWAPTRHSDRFYVIHLEHEDKSKPRDLAIRLDPNSYWTHNPVIGRDPQNRALERILNGYRLRYGIKRQEDGQYASSEFKAEMNQSKRWPLPCRHIESRDNSVNSGYQLPGNSNNGQAMGAMAMQQNGQRNTSNGQTIGSVLLNQQIQPQNVNTANRGGNQGLNVRGLGLNPNASEFRMNPWRNY